MGKDIGIDLGTATVLVYVKGSGIVIKEPSVVAIDKNTDRIIKVGREAQRMLGRTPGNITAIRPLRDGVISQYEITLKMIQYFIKKACGTMIFKPRVIICVPSGITEVEERAVVDAATQAGAKRTYLIEEPVAAAIGAGINIAAPNGHMVVDIGGGTTDIAVLSLGGVVVSESIKVAGDKFDEAIIRYVRRKHNVLIGERTAEAIKIKIGCAWPRKEPRTLEVKGRCLIQGLPRVVRINSDEIPDALEEPITAIIEAVCSVVERTPPELIGDILSNGIVMTGGGSLLYGLDRLIAYATGIKTRVADKAVSCVAIGTGKSLDNLSSIPEGAINISRIKSSRENAFR
ncbi:MAG: rod shape-determining protein MreB [Eubacteriales bacterium]|nr:rod shape-determining protein MreB [Clostridia bacterium]MDY2845664.1 rod shape-determining protein MreB [Eubacteriales bacterium]